MLRLTRTPATRRCRLLRSGALVCASAASLVLASCAPRAGLLPEPSLRVEPTLPAIPAVTLEPPLRSVPPLRVGAEGAPPSPMLPFNDCVVLRPEPAELVLIGVVKGVEPGPERFRRWIRGGSKLHDHVRAVLALGLRAR